MPALPSPLVLCPLTALLLAMAAAGAEPRRYTIDPVHTRIAFLIDHAGFSRAIGTFSGITGTVEYDPDAPGRSRVEATVPIASLDLGNPDWNARMLERRWFYAERHPEARFVSRSIEPLGDGRLRIAGTLSLRGVRREIAFNATVNAEGYNRLTFERTLGASAELELERGDFRMGAFPTVIGSRAKVLIELEATRLDRDAAPETAPETPQ